MDPYRVLIVDDNLSQASGLAELLALKAFETLHAGNGAQALQLASSQPVDAVLLDENLPDMSGHDICRALRAQQSTSHIAIVFHTGSYNPHHHEGDAFLTYPVSFAELSSVIRGCVARRQRMARAYAEAAS